MRRALRLLLSGYGAVERFVARPRVRAVLAIFAAAVIFNQQIEISEQAATLKAQVSREAVSRSEQTAATINARLTNCQSGNGLRHALRVNVETGERELPLLLTVLPQLNRPDVLAASRASTAYQLRQFAPLDCTKYSQEILPGH